MQISLLFESTASRTQHLQCHTHLSGGDQSPLNDSDADEDRDPEAYLDLDILGLDDFVDADKLDPTLTSDIGSSTLG
ncbi:hypothetical protein KDX38_17830 [Pseudomonas sp. CDFA 602]|uniref:hypothetical protein n=1 Tax=Pseudomonas californiensis TaxID=2829823 RepID=UPI001E366578|nr:hypothetical protein [Pseudomonas californiensis]MCD5995473.1 hypothetical protein [Pseudomonas californiensis]MCD6001067.1 hypothetical protein [Pseudomonas californiensis]